MSTSAAPGLDRRLFLTSLLGVTAAAAGLSDCADSSAAIARTAADAPLPTKVPAGTSLKIASFQNQQELQLKLAKLDDLPFRVSSWANIGAGPDVINAFRAGSLDVANNAGIPPIQAHYQGYDAKIVAINVTRNRTISSPPSPAATSPRSRISGARSSPSPRGRRRVSSSCGR
jgi:sulfonate transport system substrate-binding protein